MTGQDLEKHVATFEFYPQWQESIAAANVAMAARPAKDELSPAWLRAQADLLELQSAIDPATQQLQIEVAQSKVPLPYRLGLLHALKHHITIAKEDPADPTVRVMRDAMNIHFGQSTKDLDAVKDILRAAKDPFVYAAQIGDAISDVANQMPRVRRSIPAAVLSVGIGDHRGIQYKAPTDVKYYFVHVPDARFCDEPVITRVDGRASITYTLPRLAVTPAHFVPAKQKIVEEQQSEHDRSTLDIPDLEMLRRSEYGRDLSPKKLLIGRKAALFAVKHHLDILAERRKREVRFEREGRY